MATRLGRREALVRRLLALGDCLAILVTLAVSALVAHRSALDEHLLWGALTLPAWVVIFKLYQLYDRDGKRVSHTTVDDVPWVFHALLVGGILMWLWFSILPIPRLILAESLVFGAVGMTAVLAFRSTVRSATARRLDPERVLLVGAEGMTDVLVRKMRQHPEYGLNPVGVIRHARERNGSVSVPSLGSVADLQRVVVDHEIDRIVVSRPAVGEAAQLELLRRCRDLSLKVSVLPQLFETMGPSVEVDDVEGVTLLGLHPPVLSRSSRFLKRLVDVVGSAALLVLTGPLMAVVAAAIKLDSSGPVYFVQERIGKDGRRFRLRKFRTMVVDAEERTAELRALSKDPDWLHLEHDPRITRIGRLLRHTSLDELPQLWNVLKGEMSLVGPRPLIESEDRLIDGWGRSRLRLTPGLTGSWQVLGRTSIPFEEMVKLDYLYVANWSLWTDIRLILRTLPVVLARRGAN
ncbi:MAG TPA: sugar transferase [Thermoleophilaceae bacterium]